ncbi:MAG: diguanylate cyclase [Desulfobacterales bacterium]
MKKIMVVDNDVMLLEFMSDLLEKEGHRVLTANDGLTALEKLKAYIPDIMFIDLVMPNIDGEKLCRTIRKIPELNGIYIVIVSAIAAEQEIDVSEIGANACIAKASFDKMSQYVLYVIDQLDNKVPEDITDDITGNILGLEDVHSRDITKELLSCKKHSDEILNNISEGILELNPNKKIIYANPFSLLLTGISEEKLLGSYFSDMFDDPHRARVKELLDLVDYGPQKVTGDLPLMLSGKFVSVNILPVYYVEHKSIIVILNDNTERRQAEEAIRESEDKFRNFAEHSIVGINLIQDGVLKYVNPKFAEIFGYTIEECLDNMSFRELVYPEDLPMVEENILKRLSGEVKSIRYDFRGIKKTGEIIHVEIFGSSVLFNGKPASTATLLDITERKQMENEILELSLRDHLTELYNRRGFISLAEQQIKMAQRAGKKIQLTFFDVDDLKLINDKLGHEQGDKALIETANILRHAFRQSDIIARVGGDEFAVLAIDTMDMNSEAFSKRLQQKIDEFNTKELRKYMISMSWGTAIFDPKSPISMDELMSSADKLMYIQKRAKQKVVL